MNIFCLLVSISNAQYHKHLFPKELVERDKREKHECIVHVGYFKQDIVNKIDGRECRVVRAGIKYINTSEWADYGEGKIQNYKHNVQTEDSLIERGLRVMISGHWLTLRATCWLDSIG